MHASVSEACRPRRRNSALQAEVGEGIGDVAAASQGRPAMSELRTYRWPMTTWWWVRKRTYFLFVMRELSSIFVAWWVVYLLAFIAAVHGGEGDYQDFLDFAANPIVVII